MSTFSGTSNILPAVGTRISDQQSGAPKSSDNTLTRCDPTTRNDIQPKDNLGPNGDAKRRTAREVFFKVIDLQNEGKNIDVKGEHYTEVGLDEFYKTVPLQDPSSIRVILDGRRYNEERHASREFFDHRAGKGFVQECLQDISIVCPKECPVYSMSVHYRPFKDYSLPVLRNMESFDTHQYWYSGYTMAWHNERCRMKPNNQHLYDSQRYEQNVFAFCINSSPGGLQVICNAPAAHVFDSANDMGDECSSASWRWLESVSHHLTKAQSLLSLSGGDQVQTLRIVLTMILFATFEKMTDFLNNTTWVTEMNNEFDPSQVEKVTRAEFAKTRGDWALLYRRIEDDLTDIHGAIESVTERMRKYDEMTRGKSYDLLKERLDEVTMDIEFYKRQASRRRIKYSEIFNVMSYRVAAKQATSVSQLTLLAAFFLPMSLASAILSMQTRFLDLHLVLYDFVGVVVILGTIASLAYGVFKWGPDVYDDLIQRNYGLSVSESRKLFKALKFVCFASWWIAILIAFLVGMLKNPVLGMKIFGFEAGVIIGLWILSLKGVRMLHDRHRERLRGKLSKERTPWLGANVATW